MDFISCARRFIFGEIFPWAVVVQRRYLRRQTITALAKR
jgi:hypothetical protein